MAITHSDALRHSPRLVSVNCILNAEKKPITPIKILARSTSGIRLPLPPLPPVPTFSGTNTTNHKAGSPKMFEDGKEQSPKKETSKEITKDDAELRDLVYDLIRTIKDPEKPNTLEELNVVYEEGIEIKGHTPGNISVVRVEFNPTVPHCSLATLIGLCIRIKLERMVPYQIKLDIYIKKGAHTTENEINKQINDKERIAAAMENPNLKDMVETCIVEED